MKIVFSLIVIFFIAGKTSLIAGPKRLLERPTEEKKSSEELTNSNRKTEEEQEDGSSFMERAEIISSAQDPSFQSNDERKGKNDSIEVPIVPHHSSQSMNLEASTFPSTFQELQLAISGCPNDRVVLSHEGQFSVNAPFPFVGRKLDFIFGPTGEQNKATGNLLKEKMEQEYGKVIADLTLPQTRIEKDSPWEVDEIKEAIVTAQHLYQNNFLQTALAAEETRNEAKTPEARVAATSAKKEVLLRATEHAQRTFEYVVKVAKLGSSLGASVSYALDTRTEDDEIISQLDKPLGDAWNAIDILENNLQEIRAQSSSQNNASTSAEPLVEIVRLAYTSHRALQAIEKAIAAAEIMRPLPELSRGCKPHEVLAEMAALRATYLQQQSSLQPSATL